MTILLIIGGAMIIGWFVGVCIADHDAATTSAAALLRRRPDVAARNAQANIAADVRRAEEQISRLNKPGVGRPTRP